MATESLNIHSVIGGNFFFLAASFVCQINIRPNTDVTSRYSNTFVAFVVEVHIDQINTNLLAIGVHCSPTTSCVYLFAVDGSRIIHAIEIEDKVTSCCFINSKVCADSALNAFDGCIIVGTETGKILIIDLFVESCLRVLNGSQFYNNEPKICKIVSSATFQTIGTEQYSNGPDDIGFGVQLEGEKYIR